MMDTERITLAHGNGGRFMRELIDGIFARHLANPELDPRTDAAPLDLPPGARVMVTTDGFTVQPLEFPGGDIGSLAVHGTVNDLAVSGARPLYLTLNVIIEEGLERACLDRIAASIGQAARAAGVRVVAGDTKVVPRGQGGGLYLATTGIGIADPRLSPGIDRVLPGDSIMVSGPVGDHGIAVMLAREAFDLKGNLASDCASVLGLTETLAPLGEAVHFMRDPTRGGIATVAHEIAAASGCDLRLTETAIPVRDQVRSVCEMLGYDPWYLACEGRVVAVVSDAVAAAALALWQDLPEGREAAIIGRTVPGQGRVILETGIGGERLLAELEDDPLPRIC